MSNASLSHLMDSSLQIWDEFILRATLRHHDNAMLRIIRKTNELTNPEPHHYAQMLGVIYDIVETYGAAGTEPNLLSPQQVLNNTFNMYKRRQFE